MADPEGLEKLNKVNNFDEYETKWLPEGYQRLKKALVPPFCVPASPRNALSGWMVETPVSERLPFREVKPQWLSE